MVCCFEACSKTEHNGLEYVVWAAVDLMVAGRKGRKKQCSVNPFKGTKLLPANIPPPPSSL